MFRVFYSANMVNTYNDKNSEIKTADSSVHICVHTCVCYIFYISSVFRYVALIWCNDFKI